MAEAEKTIALSVTKRQALILKELLYKASVSITMARDAAALLDGVEATCKAFADEKAA